MRNSPSIAIVGAGIAGLTAAISLARRGIPVDIIEQAPQLSTIGAGLQLSPNATAILARLDLLPALEAVWTEPEAICLVDGRTLESLAQVQAGSFARKRWNAPYGVLHRASLQRILIEAVERQPLCRVYLGQRLEDTRPETIAAVTGNSARLVVGADGVWSVTRKQVPGAGSARFSGNIAYRMMVGWRDAPTIFHRNKVMAFLGPNAHVVVYPLREMKTFNVVAILAGKSAITAFDGTPSDAMRAEWMSAYAGWHRDLLHLMTQSQTPAYWPLYEATDGAWEDHGTVLIGDAAHAMMPFAAQGAAMAIEDAWELAAFLDHDRPQADALAAFVARRKGRIKKVRSRGAFNRYAYHASGVVRIVRDLILSRKRPETLAVDLDWLYGYDARD